MICRLLHHLFHIKEYTKNMDEERPSALKPLKNHPTSVRVADDVEDDEPPKPPKTHEPVGPNYYKHKKRSFHPFLIIVVLLLLAAGAIYWFMIRAQPAKSPAKKTTGSSQNDSSTTSLPTTHYDSSNFSLGFNYPKGWKLSDEAGSGKLTVTSTSMQLKAANGQNVTGQAVLLMRDTTQPLNEFAKGNATAVADSQKISYTKPTQTQRADTYISFINYASSAATGLDGIYITGDAGYQKEQAIPSIDIAKIQPVIDVTFLKCNNSKCSGTGTPITLNSSAWNSTSFSKPIKTMLQSLAVQ
jgi:cytoskeletal protein RodZ